ncbi:DNA excision repair protein ERCC-6-like [Pararge aegeria]|uniref:DNA excision repair protein ERCC-6-like n=1 Tax=Pararge aegeria TaxID=116150 RepID=UPI0019CFDE2D|nr:DNA excision repair protein ERCC-6-like [Pararge aegeria]
MVDVFLNKYLLTQLALAKQKQEVKLTKEKSVSHKSKKLANRISKIQDKNYQKNHVRERCGTKTLSQPRASTDKHEAEGEYIPSSDEETDIHCPTLPFRRPKQNNKNNLTPKSEEDEEYYPSEDEDIYCPNLASSSGIKPNKTKKKLDKEDEEYFPSWEEDEDVYCPGLSSSLRTEINKTKKRKDEEYLSLLDEDKDILCSTSRIKQNNIKKIVDDGDTKLYKTRVDNWRNSLKSASVGNYNELYNSADIQYVLDGNKDPNGNHELQNGLCIPNYIWKQLYKYQRTGVKWLWELHQVQSGGLLGDEMGLGKTVQIIAFLAGLCGSDEGSWGGLGPSIIVAPATVIYQWVSHFHFWCPQLRVAVLHHSGSHAGNHSKLIKDLHFSHGILLITYAGIVKYINDLLSKKWQYIILDEGHKIRNPDTQVSKLVKKFETPHRIIITGSPMQNSLQELWSLFDFMRPRLLGTYTAFMEHFAVPITQGGYANATEYQEAIALEIAKALKNMITPYMLRTTKAEVQEHIKLPEKNEQVLFCALSKEQRDLYMGYLMGSTVRSIIDRDSKSGEPLRARVFVALSTLRKICNHPDLYLYEAQEDNEQIDEETFGHWKRSGKMSVVHSLLKIWLKQGHRTLLFSQSRSMLCLLEQHLQNNGFKYLKMDGSVTVSQRQGLIKTFNENAEYLVFLATTRVGGLGVNLTGADRVIIYDPDWNPATDNQAKERAWRIGQNRDVTVYRLLSAGTIEEKIYQRQIFKNFLSNKILIDPNQKNVLTTSTLQGLFTLEDLNSEGDTETAALFKHTKVDMAAKPKTKKNKVTNSVSNSKRKFEEMKKKAKEISKKLKIEFQAITQEDPREKYKKKRELLLNPPVIEEPQLNIIDDIVTDVPFQNVLSELDIINKHTKVDYEQNLLKDVLINQEKVEEVTDLQVEEGEIVTEKLNDNVDAAQPSSSIENEGKLKKSRKRKNSTSLSKLENVVSIKKVKCKGDKNIKEKCLNDDDYVLSKLFAKSTVKNALHHDVVVGLAEKEKRHRIREEAVKKAKKAVKAIKFSS